ELSGKPPYSIPPRPGWPASGLGISNYVALSATHLARMQGPTTDTSGADGVLVPDVNVSMRQIRDGTSRTYLVCESREPALNAWIDGGVNWVVGANPNNAAAPVADTKGWITLRKGATALNVGPPEPSSPVRYLPK